MVTCVPVPFTFRKDSVPPASSILAIIAVFFPHEWPSVDPSTLTITRAAGYANVNCIVSRPAPPPSSPSATEPLKVFFKINGELDGEIAVFKHLVPDKQQEAQLCYDYGQSGLGPRMYGFFQTQDGAFGRVDEFIDARTLTPTDVEDEETRRDVARAMAAFHALKTTREGKDMGEYYDAVTTELARYHKLQTLKDAARKSGANIDAIIDYDFVSKIRQATTSLGALGAKTGWCVHDVQYGNVLVRSGPLPSRPRVCLVDFEFVFGNYRGFDVAGHFLQKLFQWFDPERKLTGAAAYTDAEKAHFCEEYASRWNEETGDCDTGAQVLREEELGYLLVITFEIHNMLNYVDEEGEAEALEMEALERLFAEFVKQWEKLALE